ncbi:MULTISPECIES: hypothetical protein [Calothrix]|uniref:Uncharacterized protein n=2 Tax=Calothrix TaxID=1186 RepID=A0ABR8AHJ8_9CYAN|nr:MULTISPECIES: hypothetical protein [Calothrix]MBD2199491.1 hypothetical protein [Calothrix parietina FACHB-288]MBD2228129.1 hypothetical protein [Calothrix anomala FACHB-343]
MTINYDALNYLIQGIVFPARIRQTELNAVRERRKAHKQQRKARWAEAS